MVLRVASRGVVSGRLLANAGRPPAWLRSERGGSMYRLL